MWQCIIAYCENGRLQSSFIHVGSASLPVYTALHIHVYTYTHTVMHTHTCTCTYTYTHTVMHTHTFMTVYIVYTYIHVYIQEFEFFKKYDSAEVAVATWLQKIDVVSS